VLGAGGGGDIVGALSVARLCESLGTPFVLGGVAWERIVVDPQPGPRPIAEIDGGRPLGSAAVLAEATTSTADGVRFSEALMAEWLGTGTVLIDVTGGAEGAAAGIAAAAADLGCDLVVCADVGGDMLAVGDEPGLASPLCDAIMLAAAVAAGTGEPAPDVLLAVIGAGCDGELTPDEVSARVAAAARAGAWLGAWGIEPATADEIEAAARASYTEASMMVARCARGETGEVPIRGGRRTVELGPLGALVFFIDPLILLGEVAPLAAAVAGSAAIEAARRTLADRGVRTELDYERSRAAEAN
jgi:hypothetical protein